MGGGGICIVVEYQTTDGDVWSYEIPAVWHGVLSQTLIPHSTSSLHLEFP